MIAVPEEVRSVIEGIPAVGGFDQAFVLLTTAPGGEVDVCLLSRTELRAGPASILLVVASTKARRNLESAGTATLLAVAGGAAHHLYLEVRRTVTGEGMLAAEMAVVRALRDDLGVELQPMRFRVQDHLRVEERWDATADMLSRLEASGAPT